MGLRRIYFSFSSYHTKEINSSYDIISLNDLKDITVTINNLIFLTKVFFKAFVRRVEGLRENFWNRS